MDPNNNQPVNQPAPGPVGNGQSVQFNNGVHVGAKVAKSNKKTGLIFGIAGAAVLVIAGVVVFLVLKNKNDNTIDFEEGNKVSLYSERAAKVNPMNYELSEKDNDEAEQKALDLLDASEMDTDALLKYFKDKIKAELDKNNTDEALKFLWKEQDILQERGMNDLVLKVLLEMDDSKLVKFQKIFLYRAIVTAAVMNDDAETLAKYEALVMELDPPTDYIYPTDDSSAEETEESGEPEESDESDESYEGED